MGASGLRRTCAICLVTVPLSISELAPAQQNDDYAAALSLFEDGQRLAGQGDYAEARSKFAASLKLVPKLGTLLNLADCYEHLGQVASAWARFSEAALIARSAKESDREQYARDHVASLEPRLSRLTIRVSTDLPGLVVSRDGTVLERGAWGTPIPVDPGSHRVGATAPGHEQWETQVTVSTSGQSTTVDIPELRSASASITRPTDLGSPLREPSKDTGLSRDTSSGGNGHLLAWTLLASGAAIGIGGAALMVAEADRASAARGANDPAAFDAASSLWTAGLVGTIAGGLALGAGVILLATSSGSSTTAGQIRLGPWIGAGAAGLRGDW